LEKNLPTEFAKLEVKGTASSTSEAGAVTGEEEEKKRQKRGGKGMIKANKKKDDGDKDRKISVSRAPRGKKKSVTVVTGMSSFGKDKFVTFEMWRSEIIFSHMLQESTSS
jgi:density-regulated protein